VYVDQHKRPDDLVVCHDAIAQELGSPVTHNHARSYRRRAEFRVKATWQAIADGQVTDAWVIRTAPGPERRAHIAALLGAEVVLLVPPLDVLIERAALRDDPAATERAIRRWLAIEAGGRVEHAFD
jgi:hypothetical protein